MRRAILLVLDGCGIGALPDAPLYGEYDELSATLPHVAAKAGGLRLPYLQLLGLGNIAAIAGVAPCSALGSWGRMMESSAGKDSVTGHWEMMGVVTEKPFPTYPDGFPPDVIVPFQERIGRSVIGNVAASGTEIIRRLGMEHIRSGSPIVYTSGDSVFQIAAHEDIIPLEELYAYCRMARQLLVRPHHVQRVIARPFRGDGPETFVRTEARRDFPLPPPNNNFLNALQKAGEEAHAIGVVADLFPRELFKKAERTQNNPAHLAALKKAVRDGQEALIFANCEDFDMLYGHRNDAEGFANALEAFDQELGEMLPLMRPDDLLLITADHGNDPTTPGTDHSREYVPLLACGHSIQPDITLGTRSSFADIASTLANWLDIPWWGTGSTIFLSAPPRLTWPNSSEFHPAPLKFLP